MAFDGSDFVVIDDEMSASPYAHHVDVLAQQRLRGNAYYLTTGREPCTLTLYHGDENLYSTASDFPGDRPWMSLSDFAAGVRIPLYVSAGLESVVLSLLYRVECPYDKATYNEPQAGGDIYYSARVRAPNGIYIGTATGTLTRAVATAYTQDEAVYTMSEIAITFSGYVGTPGYGTLEFRIKSEIGDATGDTLTLTAAGGISARTTANGDVTYPASPPTIDSPDLWVFEHPDGDLYEIFGVRPDGTAPELLYVWPEIFSKLNFMLGKTCTFYWLTYIQVRSVSIDCVYGEDSVAPIPIDSLQADQPVRAAGFLKHAIHPTTLYQRPRMISAGPPGYRPTRLETWNGEYHTRWPVATGGAAETFVDDSVFLDIDNTGRIEIVLDLIPTFYSPQSGQATGASQWTLSAALYEYDLPDTTWATPTTVASASVSNQTLTTYRVSTPGAYSFNPANGVGYPRYFVSKYILHDGQSTPEDWQYSHREGLLYEEDYQLIQRVVVSVPVTSAATGMHRLKLTGTYTASSLEGFESETLISDRLHLTCVGYTVFQYREV